MNSSGMSSAPFCPNPLICQASATGAALYPCFHPPVFRPWTTGAAHMPRTLEPRAATVLKRAEYVCIHVYTSAAQLKRQ
jgi:hypothetical protein